ncbi:sterol 3-beta-glucosyltransferase UGT80B1 isoform X2 [Humulus lupulus]|uniref:sterol 3-beta-glucosyltransferase UGT80B1 isoform X2 n=1 Tax=Humulus lupulus TaxID=3486 RepID=UPI002B414604|nr:sterol 3-beta-glucosyltransferase UGT80B1 isoform X2 [Humulus lupulus]
MEVEERTKPFAIFMAFGTKGDVYPIAAIAAGFAFDQRQYHVILITHSAHESLRSHLAEKNVAYHPISSPPFTSTDHIQNTTESLISLQKKMLIRDHRRECYSVVEKTFGQRPRLEDDFIVINFFALEGWSLAELFRVRCIVAAPYVVPYSAPSSYERHFRKEHPLLYKYLQEAPRHKVCWEDVIHWMWPLFTEYWESWRRDLNLSSCPFTDPVTGLPEWHNRPSSPLLLYGFSKEVVECPEYWPSAVRVCGFWFLPVEWQFSCKNCGEISELVAAGHLNKKDELCSDHVYLQSFLKTRIAEPLVFVGLSSVGSMGFLKDPLAFLHVLRTVLDITNYRIILFTADYKPLEAAIQVADAKASLEISHIQLSKDCFSLYNSRLFCFSGTISYNWLFTQCAAAVHHGGSGSTAAALQAGIPQVLCPFMHDQFYWAERMYWLGVAPEPLKRNHLFPETNDEVSVQAAANVLSRAINDALSPDVRARAEEISGKISLEDGVLEAVKCLKNELQSLKNELLYKNPVTI